MRRFVGLIALIVLVASCGEESHDTKAEINDTPSGPTYNGLSEQQARKLYTTCKVCHGEDGKKMFGGASDLSVSEMTVNERVAIIKYGKGKMTPYEGRLDDEEIRALAEYIGTFKE